MVFFFSGGEELSVMKLESSNEPAAAPSQLIVLTNSSCTTKLCFCVCVCSASSLRKEVKNKQTKKLGKASPQSCHEGCPV